MKHSNRQAWWSWALLSAFYAYQYILRVYPSIFTDEIRDTFHFSANTFSTLSTYCICVYSCLQIPLGLLLDRLGIRGLVISSLGLCLIGQYLFTHTDTQWVAQVGRILVGIGAAPAFMSAVKIISDSFPNKICGLLIGITCTIGTISIIIGCHWLKQLDVAGVSWQQAVDRLTLSGVILFFAILFTLGKDKKAPLKQSNRQQSSFLQTLESVFLNRKICLYALLTIGTCAVVNTLSDLWGPTFLSVKYHLNTLQAVHYNQMIFAGLMIGSFALPAIFGDNKNIFNGIRICYLTLIAIFIFFIYGPDKVNPNVLALILFLTGVAACGDILCFSLTAQLSNPSNSGLVVGWVNTINMLGLSLLQWIVAVSLDSHWSGNLNEHALRIYQADDYEFALGILLNVVVIGTVIAFFMRSKKHKITNADA